jgi:hypothetical protein
MADFADYFNDPSTQQLLGFASGLLSAGGPSATPTSFGQAASQGLLSASKFGTVARENKARDQQLEHMKTADQLTQMQLMAAIRNQAVQEQMLRSLGFLPQGATQGAPAMPGGGMPPMDPNGPNPSVMAGSGGVGYQPPTGAPAGGPSNIPEGLRTPLAMDIAFNGGKGAGGMMATYAKPVSGRAGAPMWGFNPKTGQMEIQGFSPKVDEGMTVGPGGQVGVAPGYAQAKQEVNSIPNPAGAMQTIKLSNQRELQLSQPEYLTYTQSGGTVLPPRYASLGRELPGVRFGDASSLGTPKPSTPQVSQENFPRETPKEGREAAQRQLTILHAEAEVQKKESGTVAPELQREIDRASGNIKAQPEPGVVGATQSQSEAVTQNRQQAAGKAVDEQFAKDYVAFTAGGGSQDASKQISQLQDVQKALSKRGSNLTGPIIGSTPDAILKTVNPNAIAMRERVEEVVQRSLRATLGAQFTEKEGERLISRAYNPNLGEKENSIRVGRLLTQLQNAYQQKAEAAKYFEANGTLEGWQGKLPSMSDFNPDAVDGGKAKAIPASGRWSIRAVPGG